MNENAKTPDVENTPIIKERTTYIRDKEYKVISYFSGNETANKLIYDMAVNRVLNEPLPPLES
jgi:hypothetical protein